MNKLKTLTNYVRQSSMVILSVFALLLQSTQAVFAAIENPAIAPILGADPEAAASGASFGYYFVRIWEFVIVIGGIMVLIYFIWGSIEWISAGGDASKIQKARDRIVQAVIGMIVLAGTFTLVGFVNDLFFKETFDLLNIQFDPIQ